MKRKSFTIFDSRVELTYEDYKDYCDGLDIPYEYKEDSRQFYDWCDEERCRMAEDFWENLKWTGITDDVIITGTLGLWNGHPDIVPVRLTSKDWYRRHDGTSGYHESAIRRAIEKCVSDSSIWDFDVQFDNGVIIVNAYHHDGCNSFEIHRLSKNGTIVAENVDSRGDELEPKPYWFKKFKDIDIDF